MTLVYSSNGRASGRSRMQKKTNAFEEWGKTWGVLLALFISPASLGVSFYSITSNVHYEEITKPYTLQSEIYDKLGVLRK